MICAGHEEKIPNPILKALKTKAESNLGRRRPKRTWTEAIKRGFEKKKCAVASDMAQDMKCGERRLKKPIPNIWDKTVEEVQNIKVHAF